MLTLESRSGVSLLRLAAVLASLLLIAEPAAAQPEAPSGDRRGGFGAPGGTTFPTFDTPLMSLGRFGRDEEFVNQLQLTEEQQEKIDEIRRGMRDLFRIQDPAEQAAKVEEMNQAALEVLTPEQTQLWEKQKTKIVQMRESGQVPGFPPRGPVPGVVPTAPVAPMRKPPVVEAPAGAAASASFGGDLAPGTGTAAELTFNFRYAPWTEVLKMFAEVSGLTLDLNDVPPGTFNYYDERTYTPTEAMDILNGYLLPRGYVLIRRNQFLVCVNIEGGIAPNLVPTVTVEELEQRGRNELVTLVLPLEGVEADKIAAEVKELLGPQGKVAALKNTNSLVITDIASHVRRVQALLSGGAGGGNRETDFKAIPLKFMSATEAERTVRRLFGLLPTTAAATSSSRSSSSSSRSDFFSRDRGDRGGFDPREAFRGPTPTPNTSTAQSPFANKLQISADVRTNSLLVTASSQLVKVVEEVVQSIDVDILDEHGNRVPQENQSVFLKVYTVNGGDVTQVAQTLNGMYPGLIVGQDDKFGKIHVNANATEHAEIEKLIAQLGGESEGSVAVIPLSRMEPVQASNTLRSLFSGDGSRAPSIEPDLFGRRLMVRGTPEQVLQVKSILAQMGEDGGTGTGTRSGGPVRRVPIDGRDPEEFLPLIRQAWGTSSRNPIRVVVPSVPNPIRDRRVPSEVSVPPADREPLNSSERQPRREKVGGQPSVSAPRQLQVLPASQKQPVDQVPPELQNSDTKPADEPAPEKPGSQSPIGITVMGNDLIITSADEEALDRLEEMINQLSAAMPNRTRWTVFYLRSADATEAAQLLERLFPQSSVTASTSSSDGFMGSFTGGLSSFGRGMMNATGLDNTLAGGQPLKIITDIRSNSLFVTGPTDQVGEIEQVLQLIDASELPESLRTRVPRSIPVEYSNVTEVAKIVREVYKDALEPEQAAQNQRGGGNPFAMMMGGAQQGKPRGIELTVGVDEQTNHLIVSCNDSMFRQIENLVQSIDDRERDARRTIRVVPLEKADPLLLSRTLGSVIPKVTVSGGGTRTGRDRGDSSTTPGQTGSSGSNSSTPQVTPGGFPGGFPGGGFPGGGFPGGGFRGGDTGGGRGGDSGGGRGGFGGFGSGRSGGRGSR